MSGLFPLTSISLQDSITSVVTRYRDLSFRSKVGAMRVDFDDRISLMVPDGLLALGQPLRMKLAVS